MRLVAMTLFKLVAVGLLVGLIVLILQVWAGAWANAVGLGLLIYGAAWALTPALQHWRRRHEPTR